MSKYSRMKQFSLVPAIRPYIPDTAIYSRKTLRSFLQRHRMVYIKPINGSHGRGIIRAWRSGEQYAYIIKRGDPIYCTNISDLYNQLRLSKPKTYMIQQGIHLTEIDDRPFDIRLLMIRDQKLKWQVAGMAARVAGEKYIITNASSSKGHVLKVEDALRQSLGLEQQKASIIINEMIQLAQQCNKIYRGKSYDWRIGYDIGIDQTGKLWLIEANRLPGIKMFRKLKDQTMYRTILQMRRNYLNHFTTGIHTSQR